MLTFSQFFWNLIIIDIVIIICDFVFLGITKSDEKFKNLGAFSISIIFLTAILSICEEIIISNFSSQEIIVIFDIEIIILLLIFSLLCFAIQKDSRSKYIIYIHSALTVLFFHVIIAGIFGLIIIGTIIIFIISIIILALILPYDEEYKLIITLIILSLFLYFSWAIGELFLALILFTSIIFIISLANESFRGRIISIYQKFVVNLKKLNFRIKKSNLNTKNKKEKILFYQARVKVKR